MKDRKRPSAYKRPEEMTHQDALAQMFPMAAEDIRLLGRIHKINWALWTKPLVAPPIDDEIKTLLADGVLRAKDELALLGVNCPFYLARNHVAGAAGAGHLAVKNAGTRQKQARRLKAFEKQCQRLFEQYNLMFYGSRSPDSEPPVQARRGLSGVGEFNKESGFNLTDLEPLSQIGLDRRDYTVINDVAAKARTEMRRADEGMKGLNSLAAMARQERERIPGRRKDKDTWICAFIESLGHTWRLLTGRNPSSSPSFLTFVQSAYASLEPMGEEIERGWSQVRLAVNRVLGGKTEQGRPWWDRFDRIERNLPAPGEEVIMIAAYIEKQRRQPTAFEAAMRDVASSLKAFGGLERFGSKLGSYQGYSATIEFETEDHVWVGHLDGIADIVGFHAETFEALEPAFHNAVDDYLESCRKFGKAPAKPGEASE